MKIRIILWLSFAGYLVGMIYLASKTPLSFYESQIIYTHPVLGPILSQIHARFEGFLPVRVPSLLGGILATFLFWKLTKIYLLRLDDRFWALVIFLLLPITVTAFVLVNDSVWMLVAVESALLAYHLRKLSVMAFSFLLALLIDDSAIILYIAFVAIALFWKDKKVLFLAIVFGIVSVVLHRYIDVWGKPVGHAIDLFRMYAVMFTPFLFLYFFYTLYRIFLREQKTAVWFVGAIAFMLSFLLSMRQKVHLTDFAPFVLPTVMLMVGLFFRSMRVHLPRYRRVYHVALAVSVAFLVMSFIFVANHNFFYRLSGYNPKHFVHTIYYHYERAKDHLRLNKCYRAEHVQESYLYRFYGVKICP